MRSPALMLALAMRLVSDVSAGTPEPVCVGDSIAPLAAEALVKQAVKVLRETGHDPARYRVELREEDPFTVAAAEREPRLTAVFLPVQTDPDYAVGISPADPCVVSWLWQPDDFTPWQKDVLERARLRAARSSNWQPSALTEIRVTESHDFIGVRWTMGGTTESGREVKIVMNKSDLEVLDRESIAGSSRESD